MRRLVFAIVAAWTVIMGVNSVAAEPLAVVLDVQRECATAAHETSLISELRFRLPQVIVILGNTSGVDANWRVRWDRAPAGDCRIEVSGAKQEAQSLTMPDESDSADIELAASQLAWILTMHRSEPTTPEAIVTTEEREATNEDREAPNEEREATTDDREATTDDREATTDDREATTDGREATNEDREATNDDREATNDEREATNDERESTDEETQTERYQVVGTSISLIPGRSFPKSESRRVVPRLSIGLIGNENWGLRGFEFGVLYNREIAFMEGMQIALVYNQVGTRVEGVQLSLGTNLGDGKVSGIQSSLVYNSAVERLDGLQLALGLNAAGEVHGIQTAFGGNVADDVAGVQIAFVANVADHVDGVQAGLVNFADEVDGVQFGLVNISDTADVPIGLVNIMTDEPLRFVGHTSFSGFSTVGLLHGGKTLRYLYLAGFKAIGETRVYGAGIGISLKSNFGRFFADPEWLAMQISEDSVERLSFMSMLRLSFGWRFSERFAIFLAPSATLLSTGASGGLGLVPGFSGPTQEASGSPTVWIYPELHLGFRL